MMRMSSSAEELLSKHSLKKYEWKHRKNQKEEQTYDPAQKWKSVSQDEEHACGEGTNAIGYSEGVLGGRQLIDDGLALGSAQGLFHRGSIRCAHLGDGRAQLDRDSGHLPRKASFR